MHTAAIYAAQEDDARFFNILLTLRFPLYEEDIEGDFAPFIIAGIKGDGVFLEAFRRFSKLNSILLSVTPTVSHLSSASASRST